MIDSITLTGIVATDPRHIVTTDGLAITTFRLASGQRRFDRATNSWVDAETNWYTVSTFRLLARNVARSVQKGQHVMLTGKLRLREWKSGERAGMTIEVAAESIGHDLNWYITTAIRTGMTAQTPPNSGLTPGRVAESGSDSDSESDSGAGAGAGAGSGPGPGPGSGTDSDPGSDSGETDDDVPEGAVATHIGTPALAPVDF